VIIGPCFYQTDTDLVLLLPVPGTLALIARGNAEDTEGQSKPSKTLGRLFQR
jgi:hypothetical protein